MRLDDLIEVGNQELVLAVGEYEPAADIRFFSFASDRVHGVLGRAIDNLPR